LLWALGTHNNDLVLRFDRNDRIGQSLRYLGGNEQPYASNLYERVFSLRCIGKLDLDVETAAQPPGPEQAYTALLGVDPAHLERPAQYLDRLFGYLYGQLLLLFFMSSSR
jgi:hypothetical protein